jgi:hypothetical protein
VKCDSVAIVVDESFGECLVELSERMPVWVCNSVTNRSVAERCWKQRKSGEVPSDLTAFDICAGESSEDTFLEVIGDVDLHHPHWASLFVYGVSATPAICDALSAYGAQNFSETKDGFSCIRGARGAV